MAASREAELPACSKHAVWAYKAKQPQHHLAPASTGEKNAAPPHPFPQPQPRRHAPRRRERSSTAARSQSGPGTRTSRPSWPSSTEQPSLFVNSFPLFFLFFGEKRNIVIAARVTSHSRLAQNCIGSRSQDLFQQAFIPRSRGSSLYPDAHIGVWTLLHQAS